MGLFKFFSNRICLGPLQCPHDADIGEQCYSCGRGNGRNSIPAQRWYLHLLEGGYVTKDSRVPVGRDQSERVFFKLESRGETERDLEP